MKNKLAKISALTMAAISMSSLVACGPNGNKTDGGNPNAKQLMIQLFDGGYGREWIDKILDVYEKENTDVNFTVKTTVSSTGAEQLVTAGSSPYDIVMLNAPFWGSSYAGKLESLTDVYAATPAGESKTIAEKCNPTMEAHFNIGTQEEPLYNQMAWAAANTGIAYNKTTLDSVFGAGNWKLPNTTDELLTLCANVQGDASKVYAFVFNGQEENYIDTNLIPVWTAQYMGYEDFYNYNRGKFANADGEYAVATVENVSNFVSTNGAIKAYEVIEDIVKYSHPNSPDLAFNAAQQVFCGFGSGVKKQKVAFMANGDWLESEVDTLLVAQEKKGTPQDIRMMKTPVVSSIIDKCATINDDATLSAVIAAIDGGATSYAGVSQADFDRIVDARTICTSLSFIHTLCIPNTSKFKQEAKDFLVFLFSDRAQAIYSETLNGLTMPYGYDISTNSNIKVSTFQASVFDSFKNIDSYVNSVDYSSRLQYFGGFTFYSRFCVTAYNKETTAEETFSKYKTNIINRWSQYLQYIEQ